MSEETPKDSTNPFLGLFEPNQTSNNQQNDATTSTSTPVVESLKECSNGNESRENILDLKINSLIENIFSITINENKIPKKQLVFMKEIATLSNNGLLNLELLEHALFERLLLPNPQDYVIPSIIDKNDDVKLDNNVVEKNIINYLYKSFEKCTELSKNNNDAIASDVCSKINSLIMRNVCTSIKQQELYTEQYLPSQWLNILKDQKSNVDVKQNFLASVTKELLEQNDDKLTTMGDLKGIFYPMFAEIGREIRDSSLITFRFQNWIIEVILLFITDKNTPELSELFIDYTTPNPDSNGRAYSDTILGQMLSLSILPKYQGGQFEYFSEPNELMSNIISSSLWTALATHLDDIYLIFKKLLTLNDECKNKMLSWIGNCLNANIPRGQMMNTQDVILHAQNATNSASDSFMLGLSGVLLRLCEPLFKPNLKVLFVDPTYSAVSESERSMKNIHLINASKETCLVPNENNETRLTANRYNFITECFFMTHKAIELGYRVCMKFFLKMSEELNKLHQAMEDAMQRGRSDTAQSLNEMLDIKLKHFASYKAILTEPKNDQLMLKMCEATSIWLTNITVKTENEVNQMTPETGYAPKEHKLDIKLPLQNYVPPFLKCIPEPIIENVLSYTSFMRNFKDMYIRLDFDAQCSIFHVLLIFMGSAERCYNPHLRAELAEALEGLVPRNEYTSNTIASIDTKLFTTHPDRLQIIPNLLNVFVGIEMTGQSVQFEEKFRYRKPMYSLMEFLWKYKEQRECFKQLAVEAELNIEDINPPIFLRFINLLINDAIHLLDDSLTNLQQIRTLQAAQDNGEWDNLPIAERERHMADLRQLGIITRFDNIIGKDTINMLKLLTSEIKGIFCHESMVNRVAAMLNYFLLNLVGPKKKEFKVKDKEEFRFNPAETVKEICSIYVNLKDNDDFCLAVSQDGRSYSHELFKYADQILVRIGGGQLIGDMHELAIKVEQIEKQYKEDQGALTDIPDEYLDPIMSTLMLDPVILPSSGVTVDRSTISRHLLSDQSDPFNRLPLTMNQVKPNTNLKEEIMEWIKQKRKEYAEKQQQSEEQNENQNDEVKKEEKNNEST